MADQTVKRINFYTVKEYPEKCCRIKFYYTETGKKFIFLTNNFDLTA